LQKSFTQETIKKGYQVAGLIPFDVDQILRQCSTWSECTAEVAERIKIAIPRLSEQVALEGICTDEMISEEIGDVIGPPARHRDGSVINNLRSLWLNQEAVVAINRVKKEEKLKQKAEAEAKQRLRELKDVGLDPLTLAKKAVEEDRITVRRGAETTRNFCTCNRAACGKLRKSQAAAMMTDRWTGCPAGCGNWYCALKLCQNEFKKHLPMCIVAFNYKYE
jgi:hypothetical protein